MNQIKITESEMDDLILNFGFEMFSIQAGEILMMFKDQQEEMIDILIGAGCENVRSAVHPFLWNEESKEVQQKLRPLLHQTAEARENGYTAADYLFCNIGKDWIAADNRLFHCDSGQFMTVDQVING